MRKAGNRRRNRLWHRPRAPGIGARNRTVEFLELFYDLAYVVLIAASAHSLAHHMSWAAVGEFVLVFSLIWIAWLNGSVHYDLHGRQDVSSRTFVFIQMLLVALLAIYAGDGEGGRDGFAVVYTVFLLVLVWLWYSAHAQANDQYRRASRVYLAVLLLIISMMAGSVFAPPLLQLLLWGAVVFVWLCAGYYVSRSAAAWYDEPFVSESLVERFGLFTIIVLGEVVVGVVNGISESERSVAAIATGILALGVGFGLWWVYFDLVGRRVPEAGRSGLPVWMTLHLPLTMAIAAAGAAMVGIIEHADDPQAPEISSWVLCGSVGVSLATIAAMVRTLADWARHRSIYLPATVSMMVLAAGSAALGLLRPEPVVLVSVLYAFLSLVWCVYVVRWLKLEREREPEPNTPKTTPPSHDSQAPGPEAVEGGSDSER